MTYFLFSILFAVVIPGAPPPGNAIGAVPEMNSVVTGLVTVAYGNAFVLETDSGPLDLYGTRSYAIKTGDVIVATCRSGKRPIGPPSRILTSVLPLGRGEIPSPVDMPLETILHEQLFLRPVRTTGTVDDIVPDEIDSRYLQVVIRSESATVTLPLSHETLAALNGAKRLLHADVELTGCCAKRIPSYRYLYGPVFLPFDAQSIRIIKFATDVFKHPRIPTDDTIAPSEFASLGLRTLAGTVVATWGRNNVLLRSEPHSEVDCHRIELAPGIPHPPVGLQIEVVGQPETDLYHINPIVGSRNVGMCGSTA